MFYSQDLVEEIRTQNDIVDVINSYIPIKQKGNSYFGLCPFHNESTPSFSVSPDKQLYYCFGCGAAGNVYSFIMQMENCDFVEALKILAARANMTLPEEEYSPEKKQEEDLRAKLYEIHRIAGRFFYDTLQSGEGTVAREYIKKRELSAGIQKKFGLGYAPYGTDKLYQVLKENGFDDNTIVKSGLCAPSKNGKGFYDKFNNRLMFPIFDIKGRCIAFGGRVMGKGEPKYLNSPETPLFNKKKNLYGMNFAKSTKKKEIILVEGYMDMISIYQAGFHNVAASLGTAFNVEHANLLKRFVTDVILIFDSDNAGENAALRAIPILVEAGFNVKVLQVPNGKDPDDFIRQEGSLEFSKLLVNARGHMAFQIECIKKRYNLTVTEERLTFTKEAAKLLSRLDSPIERDVYAKEIAAQTNIKEEAIVSEVMAIKGVSDLAFEKEAEKKRLRMYAAKNVGEEIMKSKGVWQAQCNLLYVCANNKEAFEQIKEYITPEDFVDDVYVKLASIIFETVGKDGTVFPAEVVNFFQTPKEQKMAAEVFAIKFSWETKSELEKAINEQIKLIKRTKADILAAKATSVEEINHLIQVKKELETLRISL